MAVRSVTGAVVLALLVALLLPGTSSAAGTRQISELDFVFTPDPADIRLGDTVKWKNRVHNKHTTTDQSPLQLWDSGLMGEGATFSYTMTAAGTYPYFCLLHERFGMFGLLQVMDFASPPEGPVGTVFSIRVATAPAPDGFVYAIQKRDPGGVFQDWLSGVDASVSFDSTGVSSGIYGFRSRLVRVSDGAATFNSPPLRVQVTG
jgi:plastocyanin